MSQADKDWCKLALVGEVGRFLLFAIAGFLFAFDADGGGCKIWLRVPL